MCKGDTKKLNYFPREKAKIVLSLKTTKPVIMLSNDCKKDILKFSAVRCKISPAKKADRKPKHYEHTYKLRTNMYSLAFFERERTVCQAAPQFCKKKSRQVLMACRDDGCGRRI